MLVQFRNFVFALQAFAVRFVDNQKNRVEGLLARLPFAVHWLVGRDCQKFVQGQISVRVLAVGFDPAEPLSFRVSIAGPRGELHQKLS